jgi:hypothetical protein
MDTHDRIPPLSLLPFPVPSVSKQSTLHRSSFDYIWHSPWLCPPYLVITKQPPRHISDPMAGSSHTHSSLLAALDGPHLDDPPSGPSTSSYSPTMGMHNNTRFDNAMDTSADTAEAARQALKRKLDAVAPITQASRFAPMFSPQRNVRRRVEDSRHAEFAQASASAISMLGYGDSSPMRGLSPSKSCACMQSCMWSN